MCTARSRETGKNYPSKYLVGALNLKIYEYAIVIVALDDHCEKVRNYTFLEDYRVFYVLFGMISD